MRCSTEHFSRSLMYQSVNDGEAALARMVIKFIGGIRGPRGTPVTLKQIEQWFRATDKVFLGKVLTTLVYDGKVMIGQRSFNSSRRANGSYVYWLPETGELKH
ncbi:MAG: hypothetical protein M0006_15645 [Magnetospirillum sp.]|nr:hypothetical protein [Magnetospirillum sp.]